jgi:transposase
MTCVADQLPDDLASAHAMILAERAARREAEAIAARAQAVNAHSDAKSLLPVLTLFHRRTK